MTRIVREPSALRAHCDERRSSGERVGLVPTMGALHKGHLSLIRNAREAGAGHIAVSIFVNPLQFAPGEDLDAYPRTFETDRAACEAQGVDVIYAPTTSAMYPQGFQTHVEVEGITQELEGKFRPSHFRGVTTVVTKLLLATGPCLAAFGEKDYQQLCVIRRMVRDLHLPVQPLACPIVRDGDGLALSSRNRYLSADERQRAVRLIEGLRAARTAFASGERDVACLEALARAPVEGSFDRIDYIRVANSEDLSPLGQRATESARILAAAHLGPTRLIDNLALGPETLP